jgi:hypothetical protein
VTGHAEPRAHLRTLAETREDNRLDLQDARTLGCIEGALRFHSGRHHRTHPANVEGCPMCDLVLELCVLLQVGQR